MSFGVTTSNIFEALSGGDRQARKVTKKTESAQQKPQQKQVEKKAAVEHQAPVGAVLAKQTKKANGPSQDKVQRPQSAPTTTATKSDQKAPEQQKGGFQTQERKQRQPRPQTAQADQQDKPRGPRAPRQEGDRKPRQEGENQEGRPQRKEGDRKPRQEGEERPRRPRQEGDRKPRQEGDKEGRPRRQEGDRAPRRPRQEGGDENTTQQEGGERKQYGQRVGPRKGREFERHSGTGRGREVAKDGEGAHSWGKAGGKGDMLAATEDVQSPVTGDKVEEAEAVPQEKTPEQIEEEENAKLVTYDEFLKQKKAKDAAILANLKKPAPRVAGEGEEQQVLKGVVVKNAPKKKVKTEEKAADKKATTPAEGKKTLSIQEFLKDVEVPNKRRENRDRENRGGDRNREGGDRRPNNRVNGDRKGGDRNNNRDNRRPTSGTQSPVPNVNDEASFPSLGGKQ